MFLKRFVLLMALVFSFPLSLKAQNPWTGLLPNGQGINWANAGISGGPPARTTIWKTEAPGATMATIQADLNSCPANNVVLLPAGTYPITGTLRMASNCTLRGAGTLQTVLNTTGSGTAPIMFGSGGNGTFSGSAATNITSGANQGSTSIVVASASGMVNGQFLLITETNNAAFVNITGSEGACNWCGGTNGSTRTRGEIVQITNISGTTITISPLAGTYTISPQAQAFSSTCTSASIENLQIFANNSGYSMAFGIDQAAFNWVKGVFVNYTDGDWADVDYAYKNEIRDSYFGNAYLHTPGSFDSDVDIRNKSTLNKIENNIFERGHVSTMEEWGAAANVTSYNYAYGNFDTGSSNVVMANFNMHGAHNQYNLWEGNVGTQFHPDSIWGSASFNTSFRNWGTGYNLIAVPFTTGAGRTAVDYTQTHRAIQADRMFDIDYLNSNWNFVGDVVGSTLGNTTAGSYVALQATPTSRSYDSNTYGYSFGCGEASDGCTGGGTNSTVPFNTAFIHGVVNSTGITWSGTVSHTLPASFYLTAKPGFWTTPWGTPPWPPIGPDVSGTDGYSHANLIPAELCAQNTARAATGLLNFDSTACYGGATGSGLQLTSSGWSLCFLPSCNPGGSGTPTSVSQTFGAASLFSVSGPAFSNALAVWKSTTTSTQTSFISSFNVTFGTNIASSQAIEFDMFRFTSGVEYMMGMQCDVNGGGIWDVWNQSTGTWVPTGKACSFAANTPYSISVNSGTSGSNMVYNSVTVNGVITTFNLTEPSGATAFSDAFGIQFQLDEASNGLTQNETLSNVSLSTSTPAGGQPSPPTGLTAKIQ